MTAPLRLAHDDESFDLHAAGPASDHPSHASERRGHQRQSVVRSCKVHLRSGARFYPARTSNVSAGGALLILDTERAVASGDELEVAIDWAGAPLVSEGAMIRARVVRVTPMDRHHQAVAIAYEHAAEISLAA